MEARLIGAELTVSGDLAVMGTRNKNPSEMDVKRRQVVKASIHPSSNSFIEGMNG